MGTRLEAQQISNSLEPSQQPSQALPPAQHTDWIERIEQRRRARKKRRAFFRLPPEVRNHIYEYIFSADVVTIEIRRDESHPLRRRPYYSRTDPAPGILLSCKQAYTEANGLYYALSQINVNDRETLLQWLKKLPQKRRGLIREIRCTWIDCSLRKIQSCLRMEGREGKPDPPHQYMYTCSQSEANAIKHLYEVLRDTDGIVLRPHVLKMQMCRSFEGFNFWTGVPALSTRIMTLAIEEFTVSLMALA